MCYFHCLPQRFPIELWINKDVLPAGQISVTPAKRARKGQVGASQPLWQSEFGFSDFGKHATQPSLQIRYNNSGRMCVLVTWGCTFCRCPFYWKIIGFGRWAGQDLSDQTSVKFTQTRNSIEIQIHLPQLIGIRF